MNQKYSVKTLRSSNIKSSTDASENSLKKGAGKEFLGKDKSRVIELLL